MAVIHIILCVIIACAQSGSSIPFSDGYYGHNGHGSEWFTNQNFEGPHNEFNSQQFSLINRNGGEYIPRNNFQNNVPPHINNFPNNGYREFINTPNFNYVSKIESSGVNPMKYHNFERHNVNAQAGAFVGQNFNQESIQVNKDVAEINQIIAQENLAALERDKIRESSFQQNYVPNVIQRRQQIEPSQTYFPQNSHFETHHPLMQNIRTETLIPVIQQVQSHDQNTAREKPIPVPPSATTQRDTEEEKKSFVVIYPDGKIERVTDIDKFIKDNPELIIQRRYRSPQPQIQNNLAPQQQIQQIVPQTHSRETLQQLKPKPDEQNTSPQIQAPQSQKPFIQQLTPQNVIISKELQETNTDKSFLPVQSNINLVTTPKRIEIETQTPIASKPLSGNPKSEEIIVPNVATSLKDIIKTVFENFDQKQTVESYSYSGSDTQQTSFKPQTLSMAQKVIETVPVSERKIIDINWNQKQPAESLEFLTHFPNGEKLTQNYKSHNDLDTSNVVKTQIFTPQILSNNEKIVIKEKEQSVEENGTSKNGSSKKYGEIDNIIIPEIVFKIEDLNTQANKTSQSKQIIVSEEVITVDPKKEEIESEVAEIVENVEISGKPVIIEKITINEVKPNDKQNKSNKKRTTEEIIIKEEIYPENYYKFDNDRKVKPPPTFDSKRFKDTLKKSKKNKSKKDDKKGVKKEERSEKSAQQVQPVIEEIIFTEEVEPEYNYKSENDENQSPQQNASQEEVIEEELEPEEDNQSKRPDQRNSKEEEIRRIDKPKNKEELIIEGNKWVEEDDSENIKKVKESIRKEKLVNKEIILNGKSKRRNEIKQENGMTIIKANADNFYVEEVNKEELAKLEKELNAEDSSERRWLAKEAFVFKTSDSTIPESIKKHYKNSSKPIYLFQLIFPSVVDREVITTIYSNGTLVEEVNEYLRQTEAEQQEDKKGEKKEKGERKTTEESKKTEEGRRTEKRKRIEERKGIEEERKEKEVERKNTEEKRKSRERENKSREQERKTTEEETKYIREERRRTEKVRKRSGEERKRIAKVKKEKEEERKGREKEYRKREEKRTKRGHKKSVEERKSMQEENTRSVKERKSTTFEHKKRKNIEEGNKRRKEHRRREEERKKREKEYRKREKHRKVREDEKKKTEKEHKMRRGNRRKEEQRRKREKEYKRKLKERKKKQEEEDCED